jgi:hypothetical protein
LWVLIILCSSSLEAVAYASLCQAFIVTAGFGCGSARGRPVTSQIRIARNPWRRKLLLERRKSQSNKQLRRMLESRNQSLSCCAASRTGMTLRQQFFVGKLRRVIATRNAVDDFLDADSEPLRNSKILQISIKYGIGFCKQGVESPHVHQIFSHLRNRCFLVRLHLTSRGCRERPTILHFRLLYAVKRIFTVI